MAVEKLPPATKPAWEPQWVPLYMAGGAKVIVGWLCPAGKRHAYKVPCCEHCPDGKAPAEKE